MTGGFNKQVFSTFTGRATPMEDTKAKKIVASVDFYESDFGKRQSGRRTASSARVTCLVLQMEMWAVAYLKGRKMVSLPLAKTGDSDRRQMLSEYTLVSRNEKGRRRRVRLTNASSGPCARSGPRTGGSPWVPALARKSGLPDLRIREADLGFTRDRCALGRETTHALKGHFSHGHHLYLHNEADVASHRGRRPVPGLRRIGQGHQDLSPRWTSGTTSRSGIVAAGATLTITEAAHAGQDHRTEYRGRIDCHVADLTGGGACTSSSSPSLQPRTRTSSRSVTLPTRSAGT